MNPIVKGFFSFEMVANTKGIRIKHENKKSQKVFTGKTIDFVNVISAVTLKKIAMHFKVRL